MMHYHEEKHGAYLVRYCPQLIAAVMRAKRDAFRVSAEVRPASSFSGTAERPR